MAVSEKPTKLRKHFFVYNACTRLLLSRIKLLQAQSLTRMFFEVNACILQQNSKKADIRPDFLGSIPLKYQRIIHVYVVFQTDVSN